MSEMKLVKMRLHAGIWEGELTHPEATDAAPELEVKHLEQSVDGCSVEQDPKRANVWLVRFAIPADLISDGVQTFTFVPSGSDETLASFSMIAGEALADDIRVEVDLLRAELDMLKRSFRRHCVDTGAD